MLRLTAMHHRRSGSLPMRTIEIIIALLVGLVLLVALKLVGLMIQVAAIGGLIGVVAGFVIARAFRK
jgi:hypothetical protein